MALGLTHAVKQNDDGPPCRVRLVDAKQQVEPLEVGDVVTFRMAPRVKGLRSDIDATATVNDYEAGDVQYDFTTEDTATPGIYDAEFHVVFGGTSPPRELTYPTEGYITVVVEPLASS